MRRRQFLGAVGTTLAISLSGCAGLNPFSKTPDVPTDEQVKYIEFYPPHRKAESVVSVSVQFIDGEVNINPLTWGNFTKFEVYKVNPDGTGNQLTTMNREDFAPSSDARPKHTFSKSTVSGGSLLLVLCVLSNGTKYTYGAYHLPEGGSSLKQVAYRDATKSSKHNTSNTSNTSE